MDADDISLPGAGPEAAPKDAPKAGMDMGPLPGLVGYALRRAQMAVFADFHDSFAPLGLRPGAFSALLLVRHNPGVRPTDIGRALGIKRANFAPLLAGLEGRGLVERRAVAGDRRSAALHLTPDGTALLRRADRVLRAHEARWQAQVGQDGAAQLLELLRRLSG
jgi:DNA-binding MarR family transcriptional regulator